MKTVLRISLVVLLVGLSGRGLGSWCSNPITPVNQPSQPDKPCPCLKDKSRSPSFVLTGNYETASVDLTLPTAGLPLQVVRAFHSQRRIDGAMGQGWSSSLTTRLFYTTYLYTAPSTYLKEADILMPDGAIYQFADTGSGTFTPPKSL